MLLVTLVAGLLCVGLVAAAVIGLVMLTKRQG